MRKSNKIIALVLSIILTVSMSATVFAATKAKPNEWDSFGTSAEGPKYPQIRGEYMYWSSFFVTHCSINN